MSSNNNCVPDQIRLFNWKIGNAAIVEVVTLTRESGVPQCLPHRDPLSAKVGAKRYVKFQSICKEYRSSLRFKGTNPAASTRMHDNSRNLALRES
jgi:hypothetical protein